MPEPPAHRRIQEGLGWPQGLGGQRASPAPEGVRKAGPADLPAVAPPTSGLHPGSWLRSSASAGHHPGLLRYLERIPRAEVKREDEVNLPRWGQDERVGGVDGESCIDQVQELPGVHHGVWDATCSAQEEACESSPASLS